MNKVQLWTARIQFDAADGSVFKIHCVRHRRKRLAAKRRIREEIAARRLICAVYGVSHWVAATALAKWNALTPEQRAEVYRTGRMPDQ